MATDTKKEEEQPSFYEDEENLKKLCDFLRSSDGPAVREALLMEKRVYYLKGKLDHALLTCFTELTKTKLSSPSTSNLHVP